jgi:hypothetical protein
LEYVRAFNVVSPYSEVSLELKEEQQKQKTRIGTIIMISRKGHQQKLESQEEVVAMISPPYGDGFRNSSSTAPARG